MVDDLTLNNRFVVFADVYCGGFITARSLFIGCHPDRAFLIRKRGEQIGDMKTVFDTKTGGWTRYILKRKLGWVEAPDA